VERKSKEYYDSIDLENLFSQWHRDVRTFIEDKNKDCVIDVIKRSKISTFDTSKLNEVLNLANSKSCKTTLERILKEKNVSKFLEILKERDYLFPRNISRGFSVEEIFELVKNNNYHPILFLELEKKYYIIDGRTRFYCCLFLNVPAKIRIVLDEDINESCKK